MKFCVWIVSPNGYKHSECFLELGRSIKCSLNDLGHEATMCHGECPEPAEKLIVLGAHLAQWYNIDVPWGSIVYNTEQKGSQWYTPEYEEDLLTRHEAWQFAAGLVAGIEDRVVSPGYHPCLENPVLLNRDLSACDVDVGLVGSMNYRRQMVMDHCSSLGLKTLHITGYGLERDKQIARCRLMVNMHYYPDAAHESVRTSYLMSNRIPVLSEARDLTDAGQAYGCEVAYYGNIAERAYDLARDPERLEDVAADGYDVIRRRPMVEQIRRALA